MTLKKVEINIMKDSKIVPHNKLNSHDKILQQKITAIVERDVKYLKEFYGVEPQVESVNVMDNETSKKFSNGNLFISMGMLFVDCDIIINDDTFTLVAPFTNSILLNTKLYQKLRKSEDELLKRELYSDNISQVANGKTIEEILSSIQYNIDVILTEHDINILCNDNIVNQYASLYLTYYSLLYFPIMIANGNNFMVSMSKAASQLAMMMEQSELIDDSSELVEYGTIYTPILLFSVFGPNISSLFQVDETVEQMISNVSVSFMNTLWSNTALDTVQMYNILTTAPPEDYNLFIHPLKYVSFAHNNLEDNNVITRLVDF